MTDSAEITLKLTISDPDLCAALDEYQDESERRDFAITAMKIGVLALRQAQGRIDGEQIRAEGERLIKDLENELTKHQERVTEGIGTSLKGYFDPEDGRFNERVDRLIKKDGELEQIIRSQIEGEGSALVKTLNTHTGNESQLMKRLDPEAADGVVRTISTATEKTLAEQREQILNEFSLDNDRSALSRLVSELKQSNGDLKGAFDLNDENSALSRLVQRVEGAQQKITREFDLNEEGSALARMSKGLLDVLEKQGKENQEFQTEVRASLAALDARREEAKQSTRHGLVFEDAVYEFISERSQQAGDIAVRTGNSTGVIRNNKKGDAVVKLGPEQQAAGAQIVIEAKENASYKLGDALKELEDARKNREASVGLFVFSARTAPEDLEPLGRYGNDVVIVWDASDAGNNIIFKAGLTVAKAICAQEQNRKAAQAADFGAIESAIREIERQSGSLAEIDTSAKTIKSGSEKILNRVRIVRDGLDKQVAILDEKVGDVQELVGTASDISMAA